MCAHYHCSFFQHGSSHMKQVVKTKILEMTLSNKITQKNGYQITITVLINEMAIRPPPHMKWNSVGFRAFKLPPI